MSRRPEKLFKRFLVSLLRFFFTQKHPPRIVPTSIKRVLVIRQHNQLGDMLCVVPFLRQLSAFLPDARITLLASPVNYDVMLHNRYLSDVINFRKEEFVGGGMVHFIRLIRFLRTLRAQNFDMAIVPATVSVSSTSDLLAVLSGARIRIGARSLNGIENPSSFCFNKGVHLDWRDSSGRHQTLRNANIAGEWLSSPDDLASEITLTEGEIKAAKSFLDSLSARYSSFIALHPGAGKPPNRWPAERFAALAEILEGEFGVGVVVTCGPMDKRALDIFSSSVATPFHLVAGKPIREVAAILSLMKLVISNDTGIMHVAAAVGAPVLSLFGPTDPLQWAPWGSQHCYIQGEGGRIEAISLEEVLNQARLMLKRRGVASQVIAREDQ